MTILLTGGSANGKSCFAEELCLRLPMPRYYIATMRIYDDECMKKVERHREMRKTKGFTTIESQTDIGEIVLPERGTALLECMCNLTANEMFDENGSICDCFEKIRSGVRTLAKQCENLIIVTNEIGSGSEEYNEGTMRYIDILGRLNTAIAERADCVVEVVCGIPILRKGELP